LYGNIIAKKSPSKTSSLTGKRVLRFTPED
jgi:hypothetical protein